MTNIRLVTPDYSDLEFCPYCGTKLNIVGHDPGIKRCPTNPFHIVITEGEDWELD